MTNWVNTVTTGWKPLKGEFNKSPDSVAKYLKDNSKDHQQAAERLNFYINRGGHNFPPSKIKELRTVFELLDKLYNKPVSSSESLLKISQKAKQVLESLNKLKINEANPKDYDLESLDEVLLNKYYILTGKLDEGNDEEVLNDQIIGHFDSKDDAKKSKYYTPEKFIYKGSEL